MALARPERRCDHVNLFDDVFPGIVPSTPAVMPTWVAVVARRFRYHSPLLRAILSSNSEALSKDRALASVSLFRTDLHKSHETEKERARSAVLGWKRGFSWVAGPIAAEYQRRQNVATCATTGAEANQA